MKKIDIYIIKKFLGTFFYSISLIIIIVIIFDISEKIDDFIDKQAPLRDILLVYYLNFVPYFINLFSPLFTFIAVIFFTSKLASDSEIIAMLCSGISFKRLLVPYVISALTLAIMSFVLANFIIPKANERRREFQNMYIGSVTKNKDRNIHIQLSSKTFAYVESYNTSNNIGHNFSLEMLDENREIYYKLNSKFIKWDSIAKNWEVEDYFIRTFDHNNEQIKKGKKLDITFNLRPDDMVINKENYETMNYYQLREHIKELKLKGSNEIKFYEVEKQRRFSFPFATIVLTIIGVSLSSRKIRGGIGMHLLFGILISFSYILFMQISTVFATFGNLSPFIATWIPNIIFLILGVYLLKIAPK